MTPTNDTLIFQHIYSNTEAAEWTPLVIKRIIRYCSIHKMDFQYIQGDPPHPEYSKHNIGHWALPYYLLQLMDIGYQNIIYLEHDCVIADMNADMREACVVDKIGATWWNMSMMKPDKSHYNDGALYVSSTPLIREFINQWLAGYPGSIDFPWYEQGVFWVVGERMGILNRIDNKYNSGTFSLSDHPVVIGLHGQQSRLMKIKQTIRDLEDKELDKNK